MRLLWDIAAYLTGLGLIAGAGEDTFIDFKPETPDNIVSIHEYKGDPVSAYTDVVHRSVQIVVRNKDATAANALANQLCKAFVPKNETKRIDFTPTRWGQVHVRQVPYKFLQDESDRFHYGFSLGITTTME